MLEDHVDLYRIFCPVFGTGHGAVDRISIRCVGLVFIGCKCSARGSLACYLHFDIRADLWDVRSAGGLFARHWLFDSSCSRDDPWHLCTANRMDADLFSGSRNFAQSVYGLPGVMGGRYGFNVGSVSGVVP